MTTRECPICCDESDDVKQLVHAGGADGRDVSEHVACKSCREAMVEANQRCPWCRDEVVWKEVFRFLDNLKHNVEDAKNPDELADLMAKWQVYEVTRSNSDVVAFAKDMIEDVAMSAHLQRQIDGNHAFLRDTIGLWARFHCMNVEGEMELKAHHSFLLQEAVEKGMAEFKKNGGGAAEHGGAMYTQLAVATLCAINNNMSTNTLRKLCREVGECVVQYWATKPSQVRSRCPKDYVESISTVVWDKPELDIMLSTFYNGPAAATAGGGGGGGGGVVVIPVVPLPAQDNDHDDDDRCRCTIL